MVTMKKKTYVYDDATLDTYVCMSVYLYVCISVNLKTLGL